METSTATESGLDGRIVEPLGPPSHERRRRRTVALAAVLLVAGAAGAVIVLSDSGNPRRSSSAIPPGEGTATVQRRTLSESSTVDGTLGYGGTQNVYDRLSGTYTWLPAAGRTIARGETLFRLDELPVVLMYGAVPAYRTLKRGLSGADVAELNANLSALGFDSSGTLGSERTFGAASEAAVRRWQTVEGLPVSGEVPLGRIVFASGARRVAALDVSLGQDPPPAEERSPTDPTGTTPASTTPPATTPTSTTPATTTPASSTPATTTPATKPRSKSSEKSPTGKRPASKSNTPSKSSSPSEGSSSPRSEGESPAAGGGELVMSVTPTTPLVTVQLKAEQQTLARVGERAPVTLPNGTTVTGRVVSVGKVASAAKESEHGGPSGEGESPTIPVTLSLARRVAGLDKAPVSVALVENVRRGVLCVPATALIATAGGGYAVQVVRAGHVVPLAVEPGMFAGGYVEVEGEGVHEGLRVLEPQ